MAEEKQAPPTKKPSAFTPVDTNRASYVTPDLFAEPVVGKAIASSTPVPRALTFTRSGDTGSDGCAVTRAGVVGASGGGVDVGSVRMVLDFSSTPRSSSGGGGGGESGDARSATPTFGTLLPPPPAQGTAYTPALSTPSQITSSPTALPAHFTSQLQIAPVAPKKRIWVIISCFTMYMFLHTHTHTLPHTLTALAFASSNCWCTSSSSY